MSPALDASPSTQNRRWVHYVNDDFFDHPDLDPLLERLLFRFERLARDRRYCDTTNDELMRQLGCSKNTLAALLTRGEALGWFRRVLIPGRHGRATARLGFVLFRRPTSRPVATDDTFDQVVTQMTAEIRRTDHHPSTVLFRAEAPERTVGGPQKLGTAVPRNWAPTVPRNWAPSPYKEKDTGEETQTTTTTTLAPGGETPISIHAPSESSSLASLSSELELKSVQPPTVGWSAPVPAPEIHAGNAYTHLAIDAVSLPSHVASSESVVVPCTPTMVPSSPAAVHPRMETVKVTPTVPAQALGLSTEGIDQALLMVLVARVVRLSSGFKVGANWTTQQARDAILSLLRVFGCPLWWLSNAVDQAERHPRAKVGNKPVESWGFIRQTVLHWTQGDGTPGSPPGSKPASPLGVPCPGGPSRDGKPSRPPPRSSMDAIEKELCELSAAELRERIVEMEATLANLSSSPRLRLGEQVRGQLAQAKNLLAAQEVGA
jgi:hypothetical protein